MTRPHLLGKVLREKLRGVVRLVIVDTISSYHPLEPGRKGRLF
jgi:hypothetical protein